MSHIFIEAVSSSTSGRLGGRRGRQALWYFVFLCPSSITLCHQIVGLITGGLEWSSEGESLCIVVVDAASLL